MNIIAFIREGGNPIYPHSCANTVIKRLSLKYLLKISPKVIEEFKKRNIELVYTDSKNAVEEFNRREEKNKVGAFHLTC